LLNVRFSLSFAAGTTDGAGAFDFVQSMTEGTLLWDTVRNDIVVPVVCTEAPPDDYYECHKPKPVLLPTGCKFYTIAITTPLGIESV